MRAHHCDPSEMDSATAVAPAVSEQDETTTTAPTVAQLQDELQRTHRKMEDWKEKTKEGVQRLREQVVQLTRDLDTSRAQNRQLQVENETMAEALRCAADAGGATETATSPPPHSSSSSGQPSEDAKSPAVSYHLLVRWLVQSMELLEGRYNESVSLALHAALHEGFQHGTLATQQQHERFKKRAEQTMAMTSKQRDALHTECHDLHRAQDALLHELQLKERTVEQQRVSLEAVEKQLDIAQLNMDRVRAELLDKQAALEDARRLLEGVGVLLPVGQGGNSSGGGLTDGAASGAMMMPSGSSSSNGITTNDVPPTATAAAVTNASNGVTSSSRYVLLSEVELEMDRLREEFQSAQQLASEHHRTEMTRLIDAHENEIGILQEECRALRHDHSAPTSRGNHHHNHHHSTEAEDEAYANLLVEVTRLERDSREKSKRIEALQQELKKKESSSSSSVGAATVGGPTTHRATAGGSGVDDDSKGRVQDLEKQVAQLTQQLWSANNAMIEARASQRERDGVNRSGPSQQSSYLKSIVVKMLCEQHDEVRGSLVPVLTSLLKLEAEDLRLLYAANPTWIRR